MIEILKMFITVMINAFNQLFFMKIELTETLKIPLGVFLLAVGLFALIIAVVLNIFNINFGGDDE